ncbi:GLPGLI family protein [Leeuwenhoekiella sp. MAR_2009_132]|uniref:GLPGLI family protein n=1 Tax=Leeuwenhoekiella sp. MAR_2009_132 TaxID=1392489 RepID=UPI00048B4722|nr:GLPGLI family protein [Leeuwenhoekiella sp. MAR_2009_132]
MKINSLLLVLAICLASVRLSAQKFDGGVATYQSKTSFDMENFGGREMSDQQKKQFAERIKNRLEKVFTLTFTKDESIYEEVAKLETPGTGGSNIRFAGGFSQGGIYKNVAENVYARENDLMGKNFLVKDTLSKLDWKLEKESKMIGQYAAFKATAIRKIDENPWEAMRSRRGGDENKEETSKPTEEVITAWYTPQIPVSQGPDEYWGLPGLILEVTAGRTVILCNKIVINPKEGLDIEVPKKGDKVTRSEYEKIVAEKTKEMAERFGNGRRNGPGGRG